MNETGPGAGIGTHRGKSLREWEPFRTIRPAPFRFLSGVIIIAAGVVLLTVFLADRHFGLFIGVSAGWQGVGYVILMRHLRGRHQY